MTRVIQIFTVVFFLLTSIVAFSQNNKQDFGTQVNLLFGLNQPLIDGFNIEGNIFHKRLVFDYSHGISLNFEGQSAAAVLTDAGLAAHLPYSTGFGVGYRFTEWLNVRFEPKWHQFELYYEDDDAETPFATYNTTTLGIGVYGMWKPFKNQENFLKGFMVAPSLRYWYNVGSTLENDELTYFNTVTNQEEIHKALNIGVGNTPWIINVSIGYSVDLR